MVQHILTTQTGIWNLVNQMKTKFECLNQWQEHKQIQKMT